MPAFLTLDSISLATPDGRPLFDGLTLALGRERTAVVGRNGCGKSTLLRVIAGEIEPAGGSVQRAGSIGVLAQLSDDRLTVAEALGVAGDLACLQRIESGNGTLDDATEADWTLEPRLDAALLETGLPALPRDCRLATLSGGERTRVALARLLIEAPDLLLLDEPTNNLDTNGREAVAQLLERWRGGVIVASHDRALLEQVDRIVELAPVGVTIFGGAWSAFADARDAARSRAEAELDRASDALRNAERAAQTARENKARRDKAGRASRAKGGEPRITLNAEKQHAENSGARVEVLTPLAIELPKTGLPGSRQLVVFKDVVIAHGARRLFGPLSFEIRGPERIAIAGANGAGKTTLLHLIAGNLEASAGDSRRLTDRVAVLDQHVGLLDPAGTILDNLRRLNPDLSDNEARAALARFAFRNKAALQIAGTLSGGERLRAGLACVFARREPPFLLLLLDEPTNHLDLTSIEVLEAALSGFDGALVAVSHDQSFLQAIGVEREIRLR
jgi:ATPase subunit of ABC transporter with duplicated ATPase domains